MSITNPISLSRFSVLADNVSSDIVRRDLFPSSKAVKEEKAKLSKTVPSKKKKKQKKVENSKKPDEKDDMKNFETWKKFDDQLTGDIYMNDMKEAIEQSKVTFAEEYCMTSSSMSASSAVDDSLRMKQKTKEKPVVSSLDEFNKMGMGIDRVPKPNILECDKMAIVSHGHQSSSPTTSIKIATDIDISCLTEHFRAVLLAKQDELNSLQEQNEILKKQLLESKKRCKILCNILGQAEMLPMTEVLVEVEKLRKIRDEYSQEISSLSASLEQERSKVHELSNEAKLKLKRR